jgi:hypothetical protein
MHKRSGDEQTVARWAGDEPGDNSIGDSSQARRHGPGSLTGGNNIHGTVGDAIQRAVDEHTRIDGRRRRLEDVAQIVAQVRGIRGQCN